MKHAREPAPRRRRWWVVAAVGVALVVVAAGLFAVVGRDGDGTPSGSGAPAGEAEPGTGTGSSDGTAASGSPYDRYRTAGWVAEENARPGTKDWTIPDDRATWSKISGYADATSIDLGEPFTLRVSTAAPTWRVSAYRIGWYGGQGGRLVWRSDDQPGVVQPRAVEDPTATRTWSAPWAPSLTVPTDETWPPGQYLMRLESSDGAPPTPPS